MASGDAKAVPIKAAKFRATFPLYDVAADLVSATSNLDSEVDKDGAGFSDCSNETTAIAQGIYYLDLNSNEMNADTVTVVVKSDNAKTGVLVIYTSTAGFNELEDILSDRASEIYSSLSNLHSDLASQISGIYSDTTAIHSTLDGPGSVLLSTTIGSDNRSTTSCELVAGSDNNNAYVGCLVILDDDAGDGEYVARTITAYTGASKTVTWTPAITEDAEDGGNIWIVPGNTLINPLVSDVLSTLDGAVATAQSAILSTLDGPIWSDLSEIRSGIAALAAGASDWSAAEKSTILSDLAAIEAGGGTLTSVQASDLLALGVTVSAIHSTLDGPVWSDLSEIRSGVTAMEDQLSDGLSTVISTLDGPIWSDLSEIRSGVTAMEDQLSDGLSTVISTLDGPIWSDLSEIRSGVAALAAGASDLERGGEVHHP